MPQRAPKFQTRRIHPPAYPQPVPTQARLLEYSAGSTTGRDRASAPRTPQGSHHGLDLPWSECLPPAPEKPVQPSRRTLYRQRPKCLQLRPPPDRRSLRALHHPGVSSGPIDRHPAATGYRGSAQYRFPALGPATSTIETANGKHPSPKNWHTAPIAAIATR